MHPYLALLRAVNVGGTGKLPMTDLKKMCDEAGFLKAKTYIASGNVVFLSKLSKEAVKTELEKRLLSYAGKPVHIIIRKAKEMSNILQANPFPKSPAKFTNVIFLNEAPTLSDLDQLKGYTSEKLILGNKEIYVYYPEGMGKSKLIIPAAKTGTARNMNTVSKLTDLVNNLQ